MGEACIRKTNQKLRVIDLISPLSFGSSILLSLPRRKLARLSGLVCGIVYSIPTLSAAARSVLRGE
jgi:hypothetical protein